MGNWNINIQGVGAHHNPDYPKDANRMAKDFVKQLKDAGHAIEHAEFTSGSKMDLDAASEPATETPAEK